MNSPPGKSNLSPTQVSVVLDEIEQTVGPLERRRDVGNLVKLAYHVLWRDARRCGGEIQFSFFDLGFRLGRDANTAREVVLGRKPRRRKSKAMPPDNQPSDANAAEESAEQRGLKQLKLAEVVLVRRAERDDTPGARTPLPSQLAAGLRWRPCAGRCTRCSTKARTNPPMNRRPRCWVFRRKPSSKPSSKPRMLLGFHLKTQKRGPRTMAMTEGIPHVTIRMVDLP